MGFFNEFPHTRIYDGDLGWLIKIYKELLALYKSNNEFLSEILANIMDVTTERLEKWLQDGTIANIIESLGNVVSFSNTTIEMINNESLVNNNLVQTLGYRTIYDEGGALFYISNTKNDNVFQLELTNGLYATLVTTEPYNVMQCGMDSTGKTDNSDIFNKLISITKDVFLPAGVYLLNNANNLSDLMHLHGAGVDKTIIKSTSSNDVLKWNLSVSNICINDLQIIGNNTQTAIHMINSGEPKTQDLQHHLYNLNITSCMYGINMENNHRSCVLDTIRIESCASDALTVATTDCYFNLIDCALNKGYGFLITGWDNLFSNCKAFCSGTIENGKSGFYLNGGAYARMINCISQQNTNSNLQLNNIIGSFIQCSCDSAGWTQENTATVYNVTMNGCTKNHIFLEVIDGKFTGYCNNGLYCQYSNNTFNVIDLTFRNNVDNYNYFAGAFTTDNLGLFSNEINVNGVPWYRPYGIIGSNYLTEPYTISNGTATEKRVTSTGNLSYKKELPLDCTFLLYVSEICTTDFAGEVIITYSDTTTKKIPTAYWDNNSNLKGFTANIRDNIGTGKTVTKIELSIHTSQSGYIENPKFLFRLGY